ncbi:MAG: XcbB/CpsF family capsular polysaccharide biosynthesis protein [Actinomycetota bacterium]
MKNSILWTVASAEPEEIDRVVAENEGLPRYFRVNSDESHNPNADLMKIALSDPRAKRLLIKLTNLGYSLYYNTEGESRFIRHDRLSHHWPAVKDGTFSQSQKGIFYILEKPPSGRVEKLVVVLSPLSSQPRLIRYFRPSFSKLQKFIAPNTAVLRVADIGGVKGAFYLDTTALPENSLNVYRLIKETADRFNIHNHDVVIYGASKGGTGAVYHGIVGGWPYVAVDPILSDHWYEAHNNDYHFTTGGIFPRSKQEVFSEILSAASPDESVSELGSVIITSTRSQQFSYTADLIGPLLSRMTVFNSDNQNIKVHPDVAPKTIYAQVMSINALLLGLELPTGIHAIP